MCIARNGNKQLAEFKITPLKTWPYLVFKKKRHKMSTVDGNLLVLRFTAYFSKFQEIGKDSAYY